MARKNRLFAKLAGDVDASGNLAASGIQSEALDTGVTVYATRASLPTSGNTAGDQAYVTGNNRLYIWNGSGWYNVALLNLAPSITSVQDSDGNTTPFILATDGTATTITITATDSDGDPITFSSTADSDFAGLATLSQDSSVFTITPFSQDSATTESGTITFTASDGINLGTSGVQTFTLTFEWTVDLNNVTYDNVSLSTTGSEANAPFGLSFSNDGANMYITGTSGDRIYQYTLSTPWDLSTATYSGQSPVTIPSNPYGCFINSDGTKIFGVSQGNIRVHEFNLSTAYDITTASGTVTFDIPEDIAPRDITFSRDGTKLFVASQTPSAVYRYDLSTAWDLSTAPAAASSSMGAPSLTWAIGFNSDGTKIYLGSITSDLLYRYDLSTPYDLSTASFDHSIDISSEVASVKGIAFKYDDGSKMYLADYDDDHVYQYSTGL